MGTPHKFWMVWVNKTPTTQHRHPMLKLAQDEAERLAKLPENIGKKVYVLEAVNWCWINPKPVEWESL